MLLVFVGNLEHLLDVSMKAQVIQGLGDVFARNRLLGFLFRNFVGLGRDEGDEFDAAFDQ